MKNFDLIISGDQIAERIQEVAANFQTERLTIVAILKGALLFTADLMRHLPPTTEVEFIRCISYEGAERGALTIAGLDTLDLAGKNILLLDDIFDSGTTLSQVITAIQEKKPQSLQSVVLLSKQGAERTTDYCPDYTLFEVPNRFVVGYGLDYNEHYRGLPDIYAKKT